MPSVAQASGVMGTGPQSKSTTGSLLKFILAMSALLIPTVIALIMPFIEVSGELTSVDMIKEKIAEIERQAAKGELPLEHTEIGSLTQRGALLALRQSFVRFVQIVGLTGLGLIFAAVVTYGVVNQDGEGEVPTSIIKVAAGVTILYLGMLIGAIMITVLVGMAMDFA